MLDGIGSSGKKQPNGRNDNELNTRERSDGLSLKLDTDKGANGDQNSTQLPKRLND